MHTDKEEEALINEEAILNIVENSQSFHRLSQKLCQTTVFCKYDRHGFSSSCFIFPQSIVLSSTSFQANCNFTSSTATAKTPYFLIISPGECICRS